MHAIGLLSAGLIVTGLLQLDPSTDVDFAAVGILWVVAAAVGVLSLHGLYEQFCRRSAA